MVAVGSETERFASRSEVALRRSVQRLVRFMEVFELMLVLLGVGFGSWKSVLVCLGEKRKQWFSEDKIFATMYRGSIPCTTSIYLD